MFKRSPETDVLKLSLTMPIEIKELHIKAIVADTSRKPGPGSEPSKHDQEKLKREIIKECVQEIAQILENKMER